MNPRERVYVALGSNLGDRAAYLEKARAAIGKLPLTTVIAVSRVEETDPVGPSGQDKYLNQMMLVETSLDPSRFLAQLHRIENENGRVRKEKWGARTLDLDIVRFGTRRLRDSELILPHPEFPNREWWQRELAELDAIAGKGERGTGKGERE
jgi:2-amino-4-hydroxy-6-hydroxymethyldihydropteridine diphosphokinase